MAEKNGRISDLKDIKEVKERKKATSEQTLAAHLHTARGIIVDLRKGGAEKDKAIAALQTRIAELEIQIVESENGKLRDRFGFKPDTKFTQDDDGEWWFEEPSK